MGGLELDAKDKVKLRLEVKGRNEGQGCLLN